MSDTVIAVENLSKRYLIGEAERRHETLAGSLASALTSPFRNARKLTRLDASHLADDAPDTLWALRDVSFEVKRGDVVGIIGRNGAGKSTLLKILSQITEPTSGWIGVKGRVASLLEVGTGFHPELTGRDNVYMNGTLLGMTKREIDRKFEEIVEFSGVERFLDTPVKRYSSGMQVRLAFAVAAHLDPEILVIDEVLAVGDAEFQKKCLGKMQEVASGGEGRTVLFVSHNMAAVLNLCDRAVLLSGGRMIFDGETDAGVDRYLTSVANPDREAPHVLYSSPADRIDESASEVLVERLELFGADGAPHPDTRTWESVQFRISYKVVVPVRNVHLCIEFTDGYGRRLLCLETRTHTRRDDIGLADGEVVCSVPQLPLAPGSYTVGVAVFVPDQRVIWACNRLATLIVHPKDVFGCGHLPPSSHAAIITKHDWKISVV